MKKVTLTIAAAACAAVCAFTLGGCGLFGGLFGGGEHEGLNYAEKDGGYIVTKYVLAEDSTDPVTVDIPSEYNDKPVIGIGDEAFTDLAYHIRSVTIPSSVKTIGEDAFYNCTNLTVSGLEGVVEIGKRAFAQTAIETLTLPSTLTTLGSGAFYHCEKLTEIDLGGKVTSIESNAFCGDKLLTSVTGLDSITYIGQSFMGCEALTTLSVLPVTLTKIDYMAFSGCWELTSLEYAGTMDQWNEIELVAGWNTKVAEVHCDGGSIAIKDN